MRKIVPYTLVLASLLSLHAAVPQRQLPTQPSTQQPSVTPGVMVEVRGPSRQVEARTQEIVLERLRGRDPATLSVAQLYQLAEFAANQALVGAGGSGEKLRIKIHIVIDCCPVHIHIDIG